ncbi:hypothetical protein CYMTET_48717, partial [Cymbomonas tetramitiformis]
RFLCVEIKPRVGQLHEWRARESAMVQGNEWTLGLLPTTLQLSLGGTMRFINLLCTDVRRQHTNLKGHNKIVQNNHGVEDFSARGRLHAGTMEAEAYELLKERMLSGLIEEHITAMAQVQPVCKLLNDKLAEGMALVASGGLLMLYKAL